MKFVSSISGLPISAGSAAYAPTNGADVSAVASAYAESAASGKLDSTASSQFITSTADLATTAYVDSSVSSKLDTTAFSTVSSNFLTSETVTATAGDGVYITSINGLGLSGQGGGGTQVVTSTASAAFLSAYVYRTGISAINGSAIIALSATTASNAYNASTAQTAYYDENGRALTSIGGGGSVTSPSGTILVNGSEIEGTDSAVVGGGGSDYESGLVTSLQGASQYHNLYSYFPSAVDKPSTIFSSNGLSVFVTATARPSYESITTSFYAGSGRITFTSTGVESIEYNATSWSQFSLDVYSASGSQPYEYIGSGYVNPGSQTFTSFPLSESTSDKDLIVSSTENYGIWAVSAEAYDHSTATASGYATESARLNIGMLDYLQITASANNAVSQPLVFYTAIHGATGALEVVKLAHESAVVPWSAIQGNNGYVTAISGSSLSAQGGAQVVTSTGSATITARTGAGTGTGASAAITGANQSSFAAKYIMPNATLASGSNILAFSPTTSMWTTSDYATGVFAPLQYGTGAGLFMNVGNFKGYIKGNEYFVCNTAYGYVRGESHNNRGNRVVTQSTYSASAEIYAKEGTAELHLGTTHGTAKIDTADIGNWNSTYSTVSSNSASWGAGGVPESTVSSIASAYAESAVSSVSGDYYSTSNPSSFVPESAISAESAVWNSASAISSYALSADVSATVDLVGSQSANWGGSALALSAGPGVSLTKSGNTLIAGLDETLLWSGSNTNISGITLNETYGNFDRVRFYWKPWSDAVAWRVTEIPSFAMVFTLDAGWASNNGAGKALFVYSISSNGTAFSQLQGGYQNITGGNTWASAVHCTVAKVVGVNRTAGV